MQTDTPRNNEEKPVRTEAHAGAKNRLWVALIAGLLFVLTASAVVLQPAAAQFAAAWVPAGSPPVAGQPTLAGIQQNEERFMTISNSGTPRGLSHYLRQAYTSLQQQSAVASHWNVDSLAPGWEYRVEVTDFNVTIPNLPAALDGLKIAHVTDLHIGRFVKADDVQRMAQMVASLEPDLIVITGDLVFHHRSEEELVTALQPLGAVSARLGIYATLGNHDYWQDSSEVTHALRATGIHLLRNESAEVASGLWLAGLDDLLAGEPDPDATLHNVPAGAATILLSHNPNVLPQVAHRPLLVLAGHSHGGQVKLPFQDLSQNDRPGLYARLMTAFETVGFLRRGGNRDGIGCWRYMGGWYEEGSARMYVGRGLGLVRPAFRLNCPAELTLIRMKAQRQPV
jgi:predicted MPP superfamily phosphohydrolase